MLTAKHRLKLMPTCNSRWVLLISFISYVRMSRCVVVKLLLLCGISIYCLRWTWKWTINRILILRKRRRRSGWIKYLGLRKIVIILWIIERIRAQFLLFCMIHMLHLKLSELLFLFIKKSCFRFIIKVVLLCKWNVKRCLCEAVEILL